MTAEGLWIALALVVGAGLVAAFLLSVVWMILR